MQRYEVLWRKEDGVRAAHGENWEVCSRKYNMGKSFGTGGFKQRLAWHGGRMRHGQIWEKAVPVSKNTPGPLHPWAICSVVLYCLGKRSGKESRTNLQMSLCGKVLVYMWEAVGLVLSTRKEGVALLVSMSTKWAPNEHWLCTDCVHWDRITHWTWSWTGMPKELPGPLSPAHNKEVTSTQTCLAFYTDARNFRPGWSCFHSESS